MWYKKDNQVTMILKEERCARPKAGAQSAERLKVARRIVQKKDLCSAYWFTIVHSSIWNWIGQLTVKELPFDQY